MTQAPIAPKKSLAVEAAKRRRPQPDLTRPLYFINRELSWLAFNRRVLGEAADRANPLLERFKFLSIVSSNLDEFFMVRVAGLLQLIEAGVEQRSPDGMTPREQFEAVMKEVRRQEREMERVLARQLFPALKREGIDLLLGADAQRAARDEAAAVFDQDLLPVLTPMAIDQGHPFPVLLTNVIYQIVQLEGMPTGKMPTPTTVIIQLPTTLPRFVRLEDRPGRQRFMLLGDVMRYNLDRLYPEAKLIRTSRFRILRDGDFSIDEEGAEDLLKAIETELLKRKQRAPVRMECDADIASEMLDLLLKNLELADRDVYRCPHIVDLSGLMQFAGAIDRPDLKYPPRAPVPGIDLQSDEDIFEIIRRRDRILFHPYHSFEPVEQLVQQAADDPHVLAIKQTLYRTSSESPIIAGLERASLNGKHVTVLVELKARFDEERNIEWARRLEQAGAHVIYGLVGFKTHCKALLVVRRDEDGIRRYVHLGTGNYNSKTARLYTDLGVLTCREELGSEVAELFNAITGYTRPANWHLIGVAPMALREKFLALIEREIEHAQCGRKARIVAKMNSLVDSSTIESLYRASRAGVRVDLIVRGICCLRPGMRGVSENITVRSIVGRYLEHARAFFFSNGGEPEIFLGSADWMPRNFDRRIELVFPVLDPRCALFVREMLELQLSDTAKAHQMRRNGSYEKRVARKSPTSSQEAQYDLVRRRLRRQAKRAPDEPVFRPSTAPRR